MKKIAIITARGGSKRIPKKNIKEFLGKPIIAYSIETAINSSLFDEVMVSTDSEEIASIAKKYGISVDTLIKDNSLTSNSLNVGTSLKIRIPTGNSIVVEECIGPDYTPPTNLQNTSTYTVKAGDNLYSIAKKFNTSVDSINKKNNLPSNLLSIGQKIKI